jgi:flagellar hook assembly protein FlgD
VRVWDIQNNSSNENTEFIVASSAELALRQVLNYPNPFTTSTKFFVEHNQCCSSLNLSIQIFTISGKLIKTINKNLFNEGFRIDGIEWDGKDEYGDKLAKGVYIYKVKLSSNDGSATEKIEKLVILN